MYEEDDEAIIKGRSDALDPLKLAWMKRYKTKDSIEQEKVLLYV